MLTYADVSADVCQCMLTYADLFADVCQCMPALRYTGASRASMPVFAGGFHSVCLLRDPPETVTFGYNRFGQLGLGGMSNGPNGRWDDGTLLDDLDAFSQQV